MTCPFFPVHALKVAVFYLVLLSALDHPTQHSKAKREQELFVAPTVHLTYVFSLSFGVNAPFDINRCFWFSVFLSQRFSKGVNGYVFIQTCVL